MIVSKNKKQVAVSWTETKKTPVQKISLALALSFAYVEILELQAGKRSLTQCPRIEQVARAIHSARAQKRQQEEQEQFRRRLERRYGKRFRAHAEKTLNESHGK